MSFSFFDSGLTSRIISGTWRAIARLYDVIEPKQPETVELNKEF